MVSQKVRLIRIAFAILGTVARPIAVAWAYRIWFRSPRYKILRREIRWFRTARRVAITSRYGSIMTYRWGEPEQPCVILLHGWSGRSSQLGAFVEPLLAAGYSVTGFDAPGHGESDGNTTSIFEIADVLQQIILEQKQPHAVIAHSFGCIASAYAIRQYQLPIVRLVAISSPTSTSYLFNGYIHSLRLKQTVATALRNRYKAKFGDDIFARTAADNNVRDWHGKLLVIHDRDDDIVPWQYGERLARARPDSEVYYTQSLGHWRILGDGQVIERVVQFMQTT